jgi:mono/diheme cytochrome c family protein
VYDTTQPGRGNGGHTFGDELSEEERAAVIEYLKTL